MTSITTTASFDIMVTSDLHGAIRPIHYNTNAYRPAGLALLASLIRRERERSPELLLVDNGDLLQGSPLASYAASFVSNHEVHPFINVLNELGYDAAVMGNHEFNYGQDLLRKAVEDSHFPWLSANIVMNRHKEDYESLIEQHSADDHPSYRTYQDDTVVIHSYEGNPEKETLAIAPAGAAIPAFGPPYVIKTLSSGVKIALLGATTHYIPNWEHPKNIEGLQFLDAMETIRAWVGYIREHEQPDVLVVSYHGGFESDLETGEPAERLTGENQAYAICRDIEGIDVLLSGHQHRQLTAEIHGVTVIQPGFSGNGAGHVSVELDRLSNGKWQIAGKQARLLLLDENSDVQPDAAVMKLTDELEAKAQAWLDQPIGEVAGDLSIIDPAALRLAAHPFIAFVHQVQMEATGAQISNTALLSEEARGFGSLITVRDVLSNFIYPNTLTVLELRGQDIRDALEQTARYFEVEASGEVVVNPAYMQPKPQHYNYDMWAGVEYELDISKPVGSRVVKLEREGIPVAVDATYSVVMNSYRAAGGGDYAMYPGKKVLHEGATDMAALVEDYIRRHQPLTVEQANNWRVVGS
ncbi:MULTISPECIES: bifunctional metallophosphatase/5'-nucleotidase [Paenibacillus]|uniref:2',3'-cyclic-nucleotide 2'-phosphodiesterase/3'-nucleotidase n=1 Tax=Paenibacillus pabuli TaxID=1472 RepID=A0A855YFY1_9BACL|nr:MULTISPECIES: bifunctional UDP-sugar hydrolase/5'-nucleotidase [Paenibacillus]PWW44953.1 2',3'-cyclic-nucleotide 2'-phosphodiesterase/3'-nucleotidase [Paenibacillus pabuli]PXW11289.1 2',3'-cyclic-nucleotide 2'-phosphodiesterase/3'-nucleotidase [Paenibacillus taichungensis]